MTFEELVQRAAQIKTDFESGTMKLVKRICGETRDHIVDADDEDIEVVKNGLDAILGMAGCSGDSDSVVPESKELKKAIEAVFGYDARSTVGPIEDVSGVTSAEQLNEWRMLRYANRRAKDNKEDE